MNERGLQLRKLAMRAGQTSLGRRALAPELVSEVRSLLREAEAAGDWDNASFASEMLLEHRRASELHERALEGRPAVTADFKRRVALASARRFWDGLGLDPSELRALGDALHSLESCDHTLAATERWLLARQVPDPAKVVAALRVRGGECDCEVLANVVEG